MATGGISPNAPQTIIRTTGNINLNDPKESPTAGAGFVDGSQSNSYFTKLLNDQNSDNAKGSIINQQA